MDATQLVKAASAALIAGLVAGCDKGAAPSKGDVVFCGGVNSCAGKSACKTKKNDCAGKNSCKGQGVIEMTAGECKTKGGTIEPREM